MHTKVGEAIILAVEAHDGQQDGAGQPYILHAMRVGAAGRTPYEIIVGVLHDTVEDTYVTPEDIREQFGEQIALAVCSVSRRWVWNEEYHYKRPATGEHVYKESYTDFILRAATNPTGRVVKMNDIKDNLARMTGLPRAKAIALTKRYTLALEKLKGASSLAQMPTRSYDSEGRNEGTVLRDLQPGTRGPGSAAPPIATLAPGNAG